LGGVPSLVSRVRPPVSGTEPNAWEHAITSVLTKIPDVHLEVREQHLRDHGAPANKIGQGPNGDFQFAGPCFRLPIPSFPFLLRDRLCIPIPYTPRVFPGDTEAPSFGLGGSARGSQTCRPIVG